MAPFLWIWVFVGLLVLPLIVASTRAFLRRRGASTAGQTGQES